MILLPNGPFLRWFHQVILLLADAQQRVSGCDPSSGVGTCGHARGTARVSPATVCALSIYPHGVNRTTLIRADPT
jgi:hypothetical protein